MILETITGELGAAMWPEPMRSHLLGVQYTARRASHHMNFPKAVSQVIQADGADAGWVVVTTRKDETHVVDIMILAEMRRRGIGTATLREILLTARGLGKPVRLNVNSMNHAAVRFYSRLGFRLLKSDDVQHLMEATFTVTSGNTGM